MRTLLVSSIGRRNEFIRFLRNQYNEIGVSVRIIGIDCDFSAPARVECDFFREVPSISSSESFRMAFITILKEFSPDAILPCIDTELSILAKISGHSLFLGSGSFTTELCEDKRAIAHFLNNHSIPTPRLFDSHNDATHHLPLIRRPRFGARSVGIVPIFTLQELTFFWNKEDVFTQWLKGVEYSVDVLVSSSKKMVCCIPRERILVRDGEMIYGKTTPHPRIKELCEHIVELLPDIFGPLTFQFIETEDDVYLTEINPRVGGGTVLSLKAGFPLASWIESELTDRTFSVVENWKELTIRKFYSSLIDES